MKKQRKLEVLQILVNFWAVLAIFGFVLLGLDVFFGDPNDKLGGIIGFILLIIGSPTAYILDFAYKELKKYLVEPE